MPVDVTAMGDVDYDELPPLVHKGADRDAILERVISGWCEPTKGVRTDALDPVEAHVRAGGYVLEDVSLWDENCDEAIDLGDLLREVDRRLSKFSPSAQFEPASDRFIVLHNCLVSVCRASGVRIRPVFDTFGVCFEQTDFLLATFGESASFVDATFGDSASFIRTTFGASADFSGATFGAAADFTIARFDKSAYFSRATFGESASFREVVIAESTLFYSANFGDSADFQHSHFGRHSSFVRTQFRNPIFLNADLRDCDVRDSRGLVLDHTLVKGARFSPRAGDPWSVLRRTYTGPMLLYHLLFLIAFFLPYVARTGFWVGVNRAEQIAATALDELRTRTGELEARSPGAGIVLHDALDAGAAKIPGPNNPDSRESTVGRVVIGVDRGRWFWLTAVALLVYNVMRFVLTYALAPMREEEERSGHTPRYRLPLWRESPNRVDRSDPPWWMRRIGLHESERARSAGVGLRNVWWFLWTRWWDAYGWMVWPHRVMSVLFLVAVFSFVWNAWQWLHLPVWLPPA